MVCNEDKMIFIYRKNFVSHSDELLKNRLK